MQTFFGISISAYRRFAREWGPFGIVLLLFFLSGASGLVYQVVWTRKLVLLFGTTAYAISTVLSVFFLGLGIGSFWGGRLADRSRNPLRLYGIIELAIGVWAILFIIGIDRGEFAVVGAMQTISASRGGGVALRAILAATFLLVPVTLMGATLPLLSKTIGRAGATRGLRIGSLYAINTVGAVSGCVFAGLYGIEFLGYAKTTYIAAAVNIGIGLLAFGASRIVPYGVVEPDSPGTPYAEAAPKRVPLVPIAFAISGFCTLALEVLWTRLLSLVFTGTTYAYTAMLASILVGIAIGGLLGAVLADRTKSAAFAFGVVECAAGVACAATLIFIERLPQTAQQFGHWFAPNFDGQMAVLFASSFTVLLVPTILIGMTFPFAVRAVTTSHARLGNDIGVLYGVNTFGGVLGAIAGGFILLPALGAHRGVVALGALLTTVGIVLALGSAQRRWIKFALLIVLTCAGAFVVTKLPHDASQSLNSSYVPSQERVIAYREGIEGTVVVSEPESNVGGTNRTLWVNGVQATKSNSKGIRMNRFQGLLPFVFDRDPKNALLICFGSGVTAGTLATSDLAVTGVELSRDVLRMAHHFERDNWHAIENPQLRIVVDDGRNFLLTQEGRYDVITFEPMPLAVAGVATFYSREFYELCRMRLAPGGIVIQWVPLHSSNLLVVRTLMKTFSAIFPECNAWFLNSDLFIVGSASPLQLDFSNAERRMLDPRIAEGLRQSGFADTTDLLSCFFMSRDAIASFSKDAPTMTDDRPWVEFLAPRIVHIPSVDESLRALRPYFESPLSITAGPFTTERDLLLCERLSLRFRARELALKGVQTVYAAARVGDAERYFQEALDIDPGETLARSYYREIVSQRFDRLMSSKSYPEAEAYLDQFDRYLPGSSEVWRLRGQLYAAWDRPEKASEAYRKLAELSNAAAATNEASP